MRDLWWPRLALLVISGLEIHMLGELRTGESPPFFKVGQMISLLQ